VSPLHSNGYIILPNGMHAQEKLCVSIFTQVSLLRLVAEVMTQKKLKLRLWSTQRI